MRNIVAQHCTSVRKSALQALALAAAAWLPFAPATAQAAPVVYNFSATLGTGQNTGDPATAAALAALPAGAFISGSFTYDATSPFTGTGTGGTAIYGNAAAVTSSFSNFSASLAGISFSDPRGFVVVGDNKPLGSIPSIDSVQYYADTETVSGPHNFTSFNLGSSQIVDMRMFWSGNFLSDQSLPGAPPGFIGTLALDIGSNANPSFISTNAIFFTNLVVTAAVPEPQTYALLLAGLLMVGAISRKRNAARG